jgi:gliding motility-associated lipoprotein GldH
MKTINILPLLFLFFITSCTNAYKDHQKVEDMKWFRSDVKTFDVDIPNDGNYDIFFTMRHSTGYPFRNIGVRIEQITPEGIELSKETNFLVVDENDEYKGDVIGQLWDIEELFSENTPLQKGKYTFKISHIMNSDPVILVMDIGLTIKKSGM